MSTPIVRTYNTLIRAEKGDLLKVVFVDASKYIDPKTGKVWFRLWAPRAIQKLSAGKTASIADMEKIVHETTGRIQEKSFPKEFTAPLPEGVKTLNLSKGITFDEETLIIKENKKTAEAHQQHKFVAAEWTHKNGHPRCLVCGDEPRIPRSGETPDSNGYGMCDGIKNEMLSNLEGLYIVDPHSRWIYEGKKTLIVKEKKFDIEGKEFYLIDNKFAYGKIRIKKIYPITQKMFEEMKAKHLVSDEEKKKWWGNAQLYGYDFSFEKFEAPKPVEVPQGVQTFVKAVKFLEEERLFCGDANIAVNPKDFVEADAYVLTKPNEALKKGTAKPVFAPLEVFEKMSDTPFEDINIIEEGKMFDVKGELFIFQDGKIHAMMELAKKYRYVLQAHFRGKSVHGDMRFEKDDHLEGFTLAIAVKDELKKPVLTLADAKAEMTDSSNWKMDFASLASKQREGGIEKISCSPKTDQPKVWLDMEGVTDKQEPGEPIPVGATKRFPGVFLIVRKGLYEPGADKPDFKEFFTQDGRIVFRYIPGLKGLKWEYWKAEDQTPYVLSDRAVSIGWMPPIGQSSLPSPWEKKIPQNFRYWEHGEKAKITRDALVAFLKEKKELSQENFVFSRRSWKGATVIRDMPVTSFYLKFGKYKFDLGAGNPLFEAALNAERIQENKFFEPGKYEPGSIVNPNKKIPATIQIADSGDVTIIEESELFLHVQFHGKYLKGRWVFKRGGTNETLWDMEKSRSPQVMKAMGLAEMKFIEDNSEKLSRRELSEKVGVSEVSVWSAQKRLGII